MPENLAPIESEQFLVIAVGVEIPPVSGIYAQAGYMDVLYAGFLANALEPLFGKTVLSAYRVLPDIAEHSNVFAQEQLDIRVNVSPFVADSKERDCLFCRWLARALIGLFCFHGDTHS